MNSGSSLLFRKFKAKDTSHSFKRECKEDRIKL